ncbi:MAG: Y-family DNA polymerase [Tidjanibacter sp.]|nr:Y-family DNA polymerase [Tidjanibacter sp.]
MFALADCNNFFVSCERVFRPDLEGKAVVVLSNNDGCAISRSNEAKRLGITMGEPFYQFAEMERAGRVTVFSSNFALYGDMSRRVQSVLRSAAPEIEVYSIDESFLNLNGMEAVDFDGWAKELSKECRRQTGIPVSVGVAPTKTLAKIASKLCKSYPKLRGGCYLYRTEDIEKVLRNFPIEDIWGIGRRYSKRLKTYGLHTAYDFYCQSEEWVRREMGITGVNTLRELHGKASIDFAPSEEPKKQICVSRSFAKEIFDIQGLSEQVSMYSSMACEKLRRQHSVCHSATVFIFTNRHKENLPQQFEAREVKFPIATDSTIEINREVLDTLRSMFRNGMGYKKAGVVLSGIGRRDEVQQSLFDKVDRSKHNALMQTIDRLNQRAHTTVVGMASRSMTGFVMNRNHLSPAYTTSWNDILLVKTDI